MLNNLSEHLMSIAIGNIGMKLQIIIHSTEAQNGYNLKNPFTHQQSSGLSMVANPTITDNDIYSGERL